MPWLPNLTNRTLPLFRCRDLVAQMERMQISSDEIAQQITNIASTDSLPEEKQASTTSAQSLPSSSSSSASAILGIEKVRAIYAFSGENDDELSFSPGDVIVVVKRIDDGWSVGNLNGRMGMFPVNYVEPLIVAKASPLGTLPTKTNKTEKTKKAQEDEGEFADAKEAENDEREEKNEDVVSAPGFSYLPRLKPGEDLSSLLRINRKTVPEKEPTIVHESIGPCTECGCNDYSANVFKKNNCNNCFHKH